MRKKVLAQVCNLSSSVQMSVLIILKQFYKRGIGNISLQVYFRWNFAFYFAVGLFTFSCPHNIILGMYNLFRRLIVLILIFYCDLNSLSIYSFPLQITVKVKYYYCFSGVIFLSETETVGHPFRVLLERLPDQEISRTFVVIYT